MNMPTPCIAQRLSTVLGVAQVDLFGSQKYAVRVKVDPRELAARGIGFDEVENAIREANSNEATGELDTGAKARTDQGHRPADQRAEDFRELIVSYRDGFPVRLKQIATRHRQRRGRQKPRLVQPNARHRSRHPASAGREHRRR